LIPAAFNEALRMEPPAPTFGRLVKQDITIDGVTLPAGAQAALLLLAGNRDPRHYDDPDTFRLTRNPADNLAFGYGAHSCAGQGLARLQANAALEAFLRRVKRFTIGTPVRRINNSTRGLDSLPIVALDLV
jgi:cytochrome P450